MISVVDPEEKRTKNVVNKFQMRQMYAFLFMILLFMYFSFRFRLYNLPLWTIPRQFCSAGAVIKMNLIWVLDLQRLNIIEMENRKRHAHIYHCWDPGATCGDITGIVFYLSKKELGRGASSTWFSPIRKSLEEGSGLERTGRMKAWK
jgi:hypothetical protein